MTSTLDPNAITNGTKPIAGNREPSLKKVIDSTARPITRASPEVAPADPVGPNDGPALTPTSEPAALPASSTTPVKSTEQGG